MSNAKISGGGGAMVSIPVEQQIIEKLRTLDEDQKKQVLNFVDRIERKRKYTAKELLRLPREERERIMRASIRASQDKDFEIFEAYSEEEFDD
jgi:hypothetical protein